MDVQPLSFDGGFGGQIGHVLVSRHVFRSAVRVAGIVDGIDADKNIVAAEHFRPGQRQ